LFTYLFIVQDRDIVYFTPWEGKGVRILKERSKRRKEKAEKAVLEKNVVWYVWL